MGQRFYIDFTLPDQKGMGVKLMTQVMSNIHRLIKHHSLTDVCIGFPGYGRLNVYGKESLGEVVRVVSENKDHLELIKGNITFKTLASVGVLSISNPTRVPEHVEEVRFFKDSKPSKKMKLLKQSDDSGKKPSYANIEKTSIMVLIERHDGSKYPIFISKAPSMKLLSGPYNSYGLSQQNGPTFPSF